MELEIGISSLKQTEEQLDGCRRITRGCAEEMAEVLAVLEKEMDDDAGYELRRRLKKYQQSMIDSHDRLQILKLGISRIGRLYGQCEEEIIESGEAPVRRYEERPEVQNLEKYRYFRISGL